MRQRFRQVFSSILIATILSLTLSTLPVAAQEALDQPISGGHFFKQANGLGGQGTQGYSVWDGPGNHSFYGKFQALGGVNAIGYPASRRWEEDGFIYQVTQGALLQYHPVFNTILLGNTFEILEKAGLNAQLVALGIPDSIKDDGSGGDFQRAKQTRLSWLTNPAIRDRYLSAGGENAAIELYGLPMSRPEPFGPFVTQRFQRIAFQYWTQDIPGIARKGDVTTILGGDLLKKFDLLPSEAALPHSISERPLPISGPAGQVAPPPAATSTTTRTGQTAGKLPQYTNNLGYGMQADLFWLSPADKNRAYQLIKDAGFTWVKQQVTWKYIEPHQKGNFDWAELDNVVNSAHASGLNILLSVVKTPTWALAPGVDHGPPANPQDFADFMRTLATRYRGKVQAYELWNEANLAIEWKPVRPGPFVELLKVAYTALKQADPSAVAIMGALTPTGVNDPNIAIDDAVYLRQLVAYNNGEVANYFDVLGVHPGGFNHPPTDTPQNITRNHGGGFDNHPSFFFTRYVELHNILTAAGINKDVWFTEFGWASTSAPAPGYEYAAQNSEFDQSSYLQGAFDLVKQQHPYVGVMIVWNLNFRVTQQSTHETWAFGILNSDWSPRPAYTALKNMPK